MPGAPKLPRWACFRPSALPQDRLCLPRFLKRLDCIWACQLRGGGRFWDSCQGPGRLALPPSSHRWVGFLHAIFAEQESLGPASERWRLLSGGGGEERERKWKCQPNARLPLLARPGLHLQVVASRVEAAARKSRPGCLNPCRVLAMGSHAWQGAEAVRRGVVGISFLGTWWGGEREGPPSCLVAARGGSCTGVGRGEV